MKGNVQKEFIKNSCFLLKSDSSTYFQLSCSEVISIHYSGLCCTSGQNKTYCNKTKLSVFCIFYKTLAHLLQNLTSTTTSKDKPLRTY